MLYYVFFFFWLVAYGQFNTKSILVAGGIWVFNSFPKGINLKGNVIIASSVQNLTTLFAQASILAIVPLIYDNCGFK